MSDRRFRPVTLLVALLVSALVACTDRNPTGPDSSREASVSSESAAARGPAKSPAVRAIDSRGGALPTLQGVWGGDHIGLTITAYGAVLDYDCAAGTIDQVFAPDAAGHFDLLGTWYFTPPVVFENWQPDLRPARYTGVLTGKSITMTVVRLDDGMTLTYQLTQNAIPGVRHCL